MTLKNGIKNMLQFYLPGQVKDVIEVRDPSDDVVEQRFQELEKTLKTKPENVSERRAEELESLIEKKS